jgi:hypothetical protein
MFRRNGWGRPGIIPPSALSSINGSPEVPLIEAERRNEEALPVYFLHIAKTISLTAALKAFYRSEEVISDAGNISVEFIKAQEHRLHTAAFVHGHAQHGVMSHLMGPCPSDYLSARPASPGGVELSARCARSR